MPGLARALNYSLLLWLLLWPMTTHASQYATQIRQADLISTDTGLSIQAKIDYPLSPTAKEALLKGVPLFWTVWLEIREIGQLWDINIHRQKLPYRLRFHALLNQYEVLTPTTKSEMFLTLNAALSYMSALNEAKPINTELLKPGRRYKAALKCQFERELLPVPVRPFSYLNSQWFLSSDWYIWSIQK